MSDALITALDETWTSVRKLLAGVGADGWHRPTPCDEWSVRDLAAHLGAIESQFQGLSQPDEPADPTAGIDAWTAAGVGARREWPIERVLDEIDQASALQLERLRALDDESWQAKTFGPVGETTHQGLAEIRLMDVYLHLLDLRAALGQPIRAEDEPTAAALAIDRAVAMTPWGAVKKAGLPDGTRVRLDLEGLGGRTIDLVVEGGRGALVEPDGDVKDVCHGIGLAYTLMVAGRTTVAAAAGGIEASGVQAARLLDGYRIFT